MHTYPTWYHCRKQTSRKTTETLDWWYQTMDRNTHYPLQVTEVSGDPWCPCQWPPILRHEEGPRQEGIKCTLTLSDPALDFQVQPTPGLYSRWKSRPSPTPFAILYQLDFYYHFPKIRSSNFQIWPLWNKLLIQNGSDGHWSRQYTNASEYAYSIRNINVSDPQLWKVASIDLACHHAMAWPSVLRLGQVNWLELMHKAWFSPTLPCTGLLSRFPDSTVNIYMHIRAIIWRRYVTPPKWE